MRGLSGDDLLKLPVRLHGIELGRPIDIVVDADARRAVGIELLCGDRVHRFLPLGAASLGEDEIAVDSALAVLDDAGYYMKRGRTLRTLRGAIVSSEGAEEGRLRDVVLGDEGELVALLVESDEGLRRVEVTAEVSVSAPAAARPAA